MEKHESKERKAKFIELRGVHEYSLSKCSEELDVSKPTLIKWERDNSSSIKRLQKASLSLLIDTLGLSIEGRLTRLVTLNEMLKTEIEQRDLGELKLDKLISIYFESQDKVNQIINTYGLTADDSREGLHSFDLF